MSPLHHMFNPRSVAVVGASNEPSRLGGRPIDYLKRYYQGTIYPINPSRDAVQGVKAYPSVLAVEGPIDLALIALPAPGVQAALEECIAKGIDACVVLSSGFAEEGPEGAAMQQRLLQTARNAGVRLLGPNCLGVGNNRIGSWVTFAAGAQNLPPVGGLSIVTQSGGFASYALMLLRQRQIGLNQWINLGNQADVDFADCVDFLVDDPDTRVILGYLEGIQDGGKLVAALKKARRCGKFVVMTKVGQSEAGSIATASHTATLAGEDAVYDAVLRQYGAYRALTVREALDVAYACLMAPSLPPSGRTGLITVSGGLGAMMADAATRAGLDVIALPADTQARLKQILPYSNVRNPVDITAQIVNDFSLFERTLDELTQDRACDMVAIYQMGVDYTHMRPKALATLTEFRRRRPDAVVALVLIPDGEIRQGYEDLGYLLFQEPSDPFPALAGLRWFARSFERARAEDVLPVEARPALHLQLPDAAGTLDEHASKALLAAAGLPVPPERSVRDLEAAVAAADVLGYPVVLKVLSRDLVHKTEAGGVALDLRNAEQVRAAYRGIHDNVGRRAPQARIEGVLVAPMIEGGLEFSLGVQNDPVFGPVVMAGLGGIFIEVLKDASFRHVPVARSEAAAMLRELKGHALLEGARGRPTADVEALVDAICRLSDLAAALAGRLESIDINPLIVLPKGRGVCAVDAVVQLRERPARKRDLTARARLDSGLEKESM